MKEFLDICRQYYGKVFAFVKALVHSDASAQDLTQDIFVKLWKNRKKLRAVNSIDDYIFILSKNTCLDYFRKAYRRKEITTDIIDDFLLSRLTVDPDRQIDSKSDMEQLKESVEKLPARQKNIFLMSCFNGLSNDEIASVLGISKKSVENQLALAKKRIKNFS
jgi:RNA polymerase sigma-70 factor, ECF subfamily